MKLTFLEAEVPLTKTFSLENGQITKVGHPKIVDYRTHTYEVSGLDEFMAKLRFHASLRHCLLKGNTTRPLHMESRAGTTNPNEETQWLCLDLDGLKTITDVDQFMKLMGLGHASYIVQYSASMGVLPGRGLSAHVFVVLDRPMQPPAIKQWLVHKNFHVPELRQGISLTRTGNALRWTLDISTCQNDKLIYIAPPVLGEGVVDSFEGDRIRLVRRDAEAISLDMNGVSAEANRTLQQKVTDNLRDASGLEKKKWDRQKTVSGIAVMPKPDVATVTGVRVDGKHTHLNLNGGDSWGYWHYTENPSILFNFKGEPNYLLSEIVPDYWASLKRDMRAEMRKDGLTYLAFRDFEGSTYYNGTYDPSKGVMKLAAAKGEQMVRDWLTENGQPNPDVLPTFDMAYEPMNPERVDLEKKWLNTYQPSEFELRYRSEKEPPVAAEVPAIARKVMLHALGGDEVCYQRFINWCACIVQFKDRTMTAQVIHGVPGTGKGLVFNALLKPMLGDSAIETRMGAFSDQFNGFLDGKLLVFVDEGEMEAYKQAEVMEGDFKNYITEPRILVRHMRQTARAVKSYLNFIVTSNKGAVKLTDQDRRYTVAPFQNERLELAEGEYEQLQESAWPLYCYLMKYPADRKLARTALENDAKHSLAAMSRNSIEEACKAVVEGNLGFFEQYVPTDAKGLTSKEQELGLSYKELVAKMGEHEHITRDELFVLLNWIVGGLSPAPAKFSKLLSHHRIELRSVRRGEKVARGFPVKWRKE